jgi:polyribonucleotide nucleotidyltransferase
MEFGAFVNFFGAKDGLVHVSQLAAERVESPSAVVKEGDIVKVKLLGFDDRGKVRLSMKAVNQETGEAIEGVVDDGPSGDRPPRGDRPRRDGDRGGRGGGRGGDRGPRRERSDGPKEGAE